MTLGVKRSELELVLPVSPSKNTFGTGGLPTMLKQKKIKLSSIAKRSSKNYMDFILEIKIWEGIRFVFVIWHISNLEKQKFPNYCFIQSGIVILYRCFSILPEVKEIEIFIEPFVVKYHGKHERSVWPVTCSHLPIVFVRG